MKMTEVESLQDETTTGTTSERARGLCARAKELEEAGKLEDARLALGEFWQHIGDRPSLNGIDLPVQADLLLRVGAISGSLGSARQIPGAQEIAKDLISESSAIFEELGLIEKVAEARVDLGICYWREGALDEARITFDDAIQRLGDLESEQRLRAVLNKAIVEQVCSRPKEALRLLSQSASLFETSSNQTLRGKFHNEFATVLKNVGLAGHSEDYFDRALMQYTAASLDFEKAGHDRFLAVVENNLALVFAHLERFDEAHNHLDRALSVVTRLNDRGLQAQFEDTRARTFLGQGHLAQAEKVARAAVKSLREGDQQSNLAAALTTHATALARVGRHGDALATLRQAVSLAGQAGDQEGGGIACLTVIEEVASILSPAELRDYYQRATSALAHSQHAAIKSRLGECARSVLAAEVGISTLASDGSTFDMTTNNGSLEEKVLRYEGELIKRALQVSDGSVTRAARLLGVTHQGLAFILNGRQKNLLTARKPAKPRRRSIIRYH
jgi:tetratricopeptide (TPR) repeat protein